METKGANTRRGLRPFRSASLAGATLAIALGAATPGWGTPAPDGSRAQPPHSRSTTDGTLDTPLEYDRAFKGGHQHGGSDGHLPASRRNVELVGKAGVSDRGPGRVADVAALGDFAYLGAFREPEPCRTGGVYVMDISNPRAPREVEFIPTTAGSYVGEGVQAVRLETPSFRGDVLAFNNEPCAFGGAGGMSLYDVTDPRRPRALALNAGDTDTPTSNAIHSVFVWQQGDRAFAVQVDDYEVGDVDIFEITNPRAPRHIAEVGLPNWPQAQNAQSAGMGTFPASLHHDVQVRNIGGSWRMVLSYWDAGYIVLDVDDPANPRFIEDSDFPDPDTLTAFRPPEGNAHYAEWDRTGRFLLAADEDFDPFRLQGRIASGPFSGETFTAPQGTATPPVDRDNPLVGPTYFVGRACDPLAVPAAPSDDAIAVIERGDCGFTVKAASVEARGYQGGIVFNSEAGDPPCEESIGMVVAGVIPMLGVVPRSLGFRILGITGYDPADCPDEDASQPPLPSPGTPGARVDIRVLFDGWGYMRLIDANTLAEIDAYAVPEALDERFAEDFGALSIHETAADPTHDLAYLSWYDAGFRVMAFGAGGLQEVGHFIDDGGNDFWGVHVHTTPGGERLVLASDRDYGLYVFRYGADVGVTMEDGPDPVAPDETITYTQRVTNTGSIAGTNARLIDALPPGVSFVSAEPSQGECEGTAPITCRLGTLAPGATATVRIVVRAGPPGEVLNTATVSTDEVDPDPRNNSATAATTVAARGAAAPRGPRSRARVAGVPRRCTRSAFRVRVAVGGSSAIRSIRVLLDGKRLASVRRRRFSVRVDASRLRPGRHRITVVTTEQGGETTRTTRTFTRCGRAAGPRFTG